MLIFLVPLIAGCSSVTIQSAACDEQMTEKLTLNLKSAADDMSRCLIKHNRLNDAKRFTEVMTENITLVCDSKTDSGSLALAEQITAPLHPAIKVYTKKFEVADMYANIKTTLGHEALHWLGYEHFSGFDLPYIAEMCCMDHQDTFLNDIGKKSCDLFKYKDSEWIDPNYNYEFTKYLSFFGRSFIGVRSSFNAAIQANSLGYPQAYTMHILEKSFNALIEGSDTAVETSTLYKYFSRSPDISQAIVANYIANKVDKPEHKSLIRKYYPNKKTTLEFYKSFSETLKNLILANTVEILPSWQKFKAQEKSVCRTLEAHEMDALRELATYTHVHLFNMAAKIAAASSAKSEMLTRWTDICGIKK